MAVDFPSSPTNGQTFVGPNGTVYTFQTNKWATGLGGDVDLRYINAAGDTMAGALGMPTGTAPLPALTFGDPDSGIFAPAVDQIAVSAGGTARLTISTSSILCGVNVHSTNGTAALPSFTFSTDTNTGMYRVGADQIGLSAGGTNRLTISTTLITAALPLVIPTATPASATAAGAVGQIAWDANYVYVCVAANSWKRAAIAAW